MKNEISEYSVNYAQLDEYVERGAQWMDRQDEENGWDFWPNRVSLEELNMASASCCILGQTTIGYHETVHKYGNRKDEEWEIAHGFLAPLARLSERRFEILNTTTEPDSVIVRVLYDHWNAVFNEEYSYLAKAWERQMQDRKIMRGI